MNVKFDFLFERSEFKSNSEQTVVDERVDAARKNNTIIINKKTSRKRKQSE